MVLNLKRKPVAILIAIASLTACATQDETASTSTAVSTSPYSASELEQRYEELAARESAIAKREAQFGDLQASANFNPSSESSSNFQNSSPAPQLNDTLLPPGGKSGECYARVWVEPTYKTITDRVIAKEASSRIEITPAEYETVAETVLVSEASSRLETTPATYRTVTEEKLVSAGGLIWKANLTKNAAPVSQELLNTAANHGIDLAAAQPQQCFHEHFVPAKFADTEEQVLVEEAYEVVETQAAEYRWVEKEILVSEASSRLEEIPAEYSEVSEEVIDVPAHTVWKKGTGPIQKIDTATGEIMCLVDIPATYKTVTRSVLSSPASTREIIIPAKYETVKVRELVTDASESRTTVPAVYDTVTLTKKVAEPSFVWHEINDKSMPRETRTGNRICLTESQPRYETVTRTVVDTPASTQKVVIPAQYEELSVRKVVSAAQERTIEIPAEYTTVSRKEVDTDGMMEWRSILCETNMDIRTISQIQQALKNRDYNPGPIDGVIGQKTMEAVNDFQRDNTLPIDNHLNIKTIKALGVTI